VWSANLEMSFARLAAISLLAGACDAFQLAFAPIGRAAPACSISYGCQMMFGGGGGKEGEEGGFMEQMKAAKEMFNPENMKKYAALGEKIQALQAELAQTEVEVATNEGAIVVKTTAMQVRLWVVKCLPPAEPAASERRRAGTPSSRACTLVVAPVSRCR